MAKKRLSKLQKWILAECLKQEDRVMWRDDIRKKFFRDKVNYDAVKIWSENKNSIEVSITRSIRNLFYKKYIDVAMGWFGGTWTIEEQKEALKQNMDTLERIKTMGEPKKLQSLLTGKVELLDEKHYEKLIEDRKKVINHKELWQGGLFGGRNIKRIKLTKEGEKKAKSLMLSNDNGAKLNNKNL